MPRITKVTVSAIVEMNADIEVMVSQTEPQIREKLQYELDNWIPPIVDVELLNIELDAKEDAIAKLQTQLDDANTRIDEKDAIIAEKQAIITSKQLDILPPISEVIEEGIKP
jgi:hypothetical protein